VPADLDTLVIALYVMVDDLLGPRGGGRRPKLGDAELVCLAIAQVLLGCGSERRWLRLANQRLGHLFPYLRTPSAYNRRLRRARSLVALAIQDLAAHPPSWGDQLRLVDSTPVPCAASRQTVHRSALAGHAGDGDCKSHHRWFWGFRLSVLATPDGLPVAWCLATPKLGEREVVAALLDHERHRLRPGLVILADKGFTGRDFERLVAGMVRCWRAPTALTALPVRVAGAGGPVDREQLRHPQRPAWAGTPRRPDPGWGGGPGRPTPARPGHRDLVELADRGARQALPGRLRPLKPQPPNQKQSSSRPGSPCSG
jgi:Transposase DDE domain